MEKRNYTITIKRVSTMSFVVEEATSEKDAKEKAMNFAYNADWRGVEADYEISEVE